MSAKYLRSFSFRKFFAKSSLKINTKNARCSSSITKKDSEIATHTGQVYETGDLRKTRFMSATKLVNTRFAIDLIREDPVVICTKRVVSSHSGKALGHPNIFINLDPPGVHICGYSGRKFVLKKYFDEKTMGPSISYEEYCKQIGIEEI